MGLEREINRKVPLSFDPQSLLLMKNASTVKAVLKSTIIGRTTGSMRGEVPAAAVISKVKQVHLSMKDGTNNKRRSILRRLHYRAAATSKQKQLQRLQVQEELQQQQQQQQIQRPGPPITEERFLWITAEDERTCPICEELEGQSFALDAEVPTPDEDTHPNCRCEVEPVNVEVEDGGLEDDEDLESLLTF